MNGTDNEHSTYTYIHRETAERALCENAHEIAAAPDCNIHANSFIARWCCCYCYCLAAYVPIASARETTNSKQNYTAISVCLCACVCALDACWRYAEKIETFARVTSFVVGGSGWLKSSRNG